MKTIFVQDSIIVPSVERVDFDLNKMEPHACIGCWTCWWATPGRCAYKDLDDFYRAYINAGKVVISTSPDKGFVSVKLKSLLDRMIPLFLPYIEFHDGGSWHKKRYAHYPDVTVYYEPNFASDAEEDNYTDYLRWVFTQFYAQTIEILPMPKAAQGGL